LQKNSGIGIYIYILYVPSVPPPSVHFRRFLSTNYGKILAYSGIATNNAITPGTKATNSHHSTAKNLRVVQIFARLDSLFTARLA